MEKDAEAKARARRQARGQPHPVGGAPSQDAAKGQFSRLSASSDGTKKGEEEKQEEVSRISESI